MANHSREEMERNANVGKGAISTILISLAGYAVKKVIESNEEKKKNEAKRREVAADKMRVNSINAKIKDYEDEYYLGLGKLVNADKIQKLRSEKEDIYKKYE